MKNNLENVLWMAEELDFAPLSSNEQSELEQLTNQFIDAAAVKRPRHWLYPAS